jgi:hypothetical protein
MAIGRGKNKANTGIKIVLTQNQENRLSKAAIALTIQKSSISILI